MTPPSNHNFIVSARFAVFDQKRAVNPAPHLKRFDGMEDISERRRCARSYSRRVSVVNIVIAAVKQIQKFDGDAPCFVDLSSPALQR